jgi:hypothetical protein
MARIICSAMEACPISNTIALLDFLALGTLLLASFLNSSTVKGLLEIRAYAAESISGVNSSLSTPFSMANFLLHCQYCINSVWSKRTISSKNNSSRSPRRTKNIRFLLFIKWGFHTRSKSNSP